MSEHAPDGRGGIDAALVRRLVAEQFPRWADLPIRPVEADGWDNRTYRLGSELSVRLPSADGYSAAVAKEARWLPVLAPRLPLAVPEVVAVGGPSELFPRPWSVRRWLAGRPATHATIGDATRFADELAGFIRALRGIDATGGPAAGEHSFFRGASLQHYDDETRRAIDRLCPEGAAAGWDRRRLCEVWDAALAATWTGRPTWFHGDLAVGNLLVIDGNLSAVIDFGTCGVGDPSCDLVIAWTFFENRSRAHFLDAVGADGTMRRLAIGWALWKALITLAADQPSAGDVAANRRIVARLLADAL